MEENDLKTKKDEIDFLVRAIRPFFIRLLSTAQTTPNVKTIISN